MLVLVDMDDVLADTEAGFSKQLATRYPEIPVIPLARRTTFDFEDQYPIEIVHAIVNAKGYFLDFPEVPHAVETVKSILAQGAEVRICTSPILSNPYCAAEKLQWIANHFGSEWLDRTIITRDKTVVRGDILIDDKPRLTGILKPTWKHVLFSRPWNQNQIAELRLDSWLGWENLSRQLFEE